jgi:type IV secretion system protein VirD4
MYSNSASYKAFSSALSRGAPAATWRSYQARNTPLDPSNARFATRREAEKAGWIGGHKKIRIGYWDKSCLTPLYFNGEGHITLVAPTGSGKARDILIPALLEYQGSSVIFDHDGALASVTAPYRQRIGQRIFLLNPFNVEQDYVGQFTHVGFNPLSTLNPADPSFGVDCDRLAEAIVLHEGGSEGKHWTDSARQLVSGVIMMLAVYARPEKRNLVSAHEYISGPEFFAFARHAVQTKHPGIVGRLGRFTAKGASENNELGSIVSTAITQCAFINNDSIAASLRATGPELRFADLRTIPTTVYLILPMDYFATCSKWVRLLISSAIADLLHYVRGPQQLMFLLDEFKIIGNMSILADLMGIGRGYKITLYPVLQDLGQLSEMQPKLWKSYLANSRAQIFLANDEETTTKYISERCGLTQQRYETGSVSAGLLSPKGDAAENVNLSMSYGRELRPLLYPLEISSMGGREMLVIGQNLGVIRAGRKSYLEMAECRGKYGPHPRYDAPPKKER